jgi:hypothetical protein
MYFVSPHLLANQVGDEGAKYISSALKVNKTLTQLNLDGIPS